MTRQVVYVVTGAGLTGTTYIPMPLVELTWSSNEHLLPAAIASSCNSVGCITHRSSAGPPLSLQCGVPRTSRKQGLGSKSLVGSGLLLCCMRRVQLTRALNHECSVGWVSEICSRWWSSAKVFKSWRLPQVRDRAKWVSNHDKFALHVTTAHGPAGSLLGTQCCLWLVHAADALQLIAL